jgi:hypothetical protein
VAGPGNILIRIGADAGQAVGELSRVNKSLGSTMSKSEKMRAGLAKAALPAAAALAAMSVAAKKAIDNASNLNEQVNKSGEVFGASAKDVVAWSSGLTKSFGLSQRAALEAAGTFGNMLVPMGFTQKEAAKMSKSMVQLAGDLASFNNASPEETLDALRSGLAGESEPLRKFGIFLSDARLKQEALQRGLYSGKGALDAHAKAAATMAIVLKDTTAAQGDFARTSDSAANQSRIQAAETEDLSAALGKSLLPAYEAVQRVLLKLTKLTADHTGVVKVLAGAVAILAAGVLAANAAFKIYDAALKLAKLATAAYTAAQWLLNAALNANPIGLVVVALAALAAGLVLAYKHSETFRNVVQGAMGGVKTAVAAVDHAFDALLASARSAFDWVANHWKLALFAFGPIGAALYVLVDHFGDIQRAAAAAWGYIVSAWRVGAFAFGPIEAAVRAIARAFDSIYNAVRRAIGAVQELIGWLGKIKVPNIKLPHIPGTRGVPPPPSPAGRASSSSGGTTVNVYGAVDPEGTARAIRRILDAHDRRQGRALGALA